MPGANRPGLTNLWDEFDRAGRRLGIAIEGGVMYVVVFYRGLAVVTPKIADLQLGEAPGGWCSSPSYGTGGDQTKVAVAPSGMV